MSKKNAGEPRLCVGIGASAGGLEALEQFFTTVPENCGVAFVVVQHLSPDFESQMVDLLSRHSAISVVSARNGQLVESNTVYLLPPKMEITVFEGAIHLKARERTASPSMPINRFFQSLAAEYRSRAVAIVLSGTGSDGSKGAVEVHLEGGLVVAQEPATAKFDGMPVSVIDSGEVDVILSPDEMWPVVESYREGGNRNDIRTETMGQIEEERSLVQILELLRFEHDIDFKLYKSATVRRRIFRRIEILNLEVQDYIDLLSSERDEVLALYNDLLIGVTEFFRDPPAFEFLERNVIPLILEEHRESRDEIRVWVAGCATGEEAYTMAILFSEALGDEKLPIKIFATDVHRDSLETAGRGIYDESALREVPSNRIEKFFEKEEMGYRIKERLRKMVVFAHHDLVKSAPFTRVDLVSCRNLMIYLRPQAQLRALSLMHFGLKKDGYFFGGPSESLGEIQDEFRVLDRHWRVFQKIRNVRLTSAGKGGDVPVVSAPIVSVTSGASNRNERRGSVSNPGLESSTVSGLNSRELTALYDLVLSDYMPPGVLLDAGGEIIHSFPGVEKYLTMRPGRPSNNIKEAVTDELKTIVRSAFQRSVRALEEQEFPDVPVNCDGGTRMVSIRVRPFRLTEIEKRPRFFLLQIKGDDLRGRDENLMERRSRETSPITEEDESSSLYKDQVRVLEGELVLVREDLQGTVEELETSNEELQSTNEEMVAANEELQSTNEELHSVNEEIHTVNAELRRKVLELSEMSADIEALFESTDVGVIFLDEALRIRRFTPRVSTYFSIEDTDEGRPLEHFSHRLSDTGFYDDAKIVLEGGSVVEREIKTVDGEPILLRLLPYILYEEIRGLVITLVDLSSVREAELQIIKLAGIVESARAAIVSVDNRGIVESWNAAAQKMFGYTQEEAMGQEITSLVSPPGKEEEFSVAFEGSGNEPVSLVTTRAHKDGHEIDVHLTLSPIVDGRGKIVGHSAFVTNITEQINVQRRLSLKTAVSHILSESPGLSEAIPGILKEIVDAFPTVSGAEFWEPGATEEKRFINQRFSHFPDSENKGEGGENNREISLNDADTPLFLYGAIDRCEPVQTVEISEIAETLGVPSNSEGSVKSVLVFPASSSNRCVGLFIIYSVDSQEKHPLFDIASSLGSVIGQFIQTDKAKIATLKNAREFVLARFDSDARYVSVDNPHPDFPPEEVLGTLDTELIPGEAGEFLYQKKLEAMAENRILTFPFQLETSTGLVTWQITLHPHSEEEKSGGTEIAIDVSQVAGNERKV